MIALIYQKKGNVGQYHAVVNEEWIIKFDNNEKFVNHITGSIGGIEFKKPLIFASQNAAIDYAKSQNLEYEIVINKKQKDFFFNSYTKNFI
jgi:hypothetical protein